jgi:DNA-directed RNA polymerase specialized sigma24 family protein
MALSKEIAPILPYLRRYARALCGTQQDGDAYVVSTLEALVADPKSFPSTMPTRVGLYRVFTDIWSAKAANAPYGLEEHAEDAPGQRNLNLLTPRSRQAFLLRTVEGFSLEEVAKILDVGESEVPKLIDEAGKEIALHVATDVLIIEDDPAIAADIEALVRDLGHHVTGIARTHDEAVALAKSKVPGLILADIELADGSSGLDAVNELLKTFSIPVIFITALPERLLTGQRPEPAFLITKPYKVDAVKATISQALFFDRKASRANA